MDFSWVGKYWPLLLSGAWQTIALLVISVCCGFVLAIGLAFAQVSGGRMTRILARGYCTFFSGHAAADTTLAALLRRGVALAHGAGAAAKLSVAGAARRFLLRRSASR